MRMHFLGFHEYDGQLVDYSPSWIEKRILEVKEDIEALKQMETPKEKIERYEQNLVLSYLETELFELDEQKEYKDSPLTYIWPLGIVEQSYAARSFASKEDRVRSIIELEKKIPEFLQIGIGNFDDSLPRAKVSMGLSFMSGMINYYKDKLIEFVSGIQDNDLIQEWSDANILAVEAMENFREILQTKFLPNAHDDFALGEEKFLRMLKKTEFVDLSASKLLEIAESDLERNYQALLAIAEELGESPADYITKIMNKYPDPAELMVKVKAALDRTKKFVMESGIVDVPTDRQCIVTEMPEFGRSFGFAAMNTPGPFEPPEAAEAYYYVNIPDPSWPEERLKSFMTFFSQTSIESVTVHEAWPGHYLQLLFNNKSTSKIAKMFAYSGTMIEGWGHYTEEMVYNAGYTPFDRVEYHAGQLIGALVRNVRFVSAVRMHCYGMTVEESKQLFMEKAFMAETTAQIEANRGTVNPMYLYYTLGKLLILKLREDYKMEKGSKYSLREFHTELLSYGSPPITILRELMLEDPNKPIL